MAFLGGVSTEAKFSNLKDGITVSNGNIEDGSSNVIYDNSNSHVPTTILQNDSVTISAGDGISGGGTPTLGSSTSLSINVSDFAGGGLQDDGTGDIELINTNISVSGSNGLSGGTASLGGSVSVGISGNLSLDSDLQAVNGETIWSETNTHIPSSALEFTDVTINGSNGLSGGTVSLGDSVSISISGNLSLDSNLQAVDGETIWDETNTHVPESALQTLSNSALTNSSISIKGTSVSLGGSISNIIGENEIGTTKIDESISPTWTGKHVFDGGIEFGQLILPTDPGNSTLSNAAVTSIPAQGDEQSYSLNISSEPIITVFSEADGTGGIQNKEARVNGDIKATGELIEGSAL